MDDQTLHHFMEDLAPIVIGVVVTFAAAWVITAVVKAFKEKSILRTRAELYNRLLDKFGSADGFVEYLESETGRQFVEEITVQGAAPINKILGSIQIGVVMALAGFGSLVLGNLFDKSLGGDLFMVLIVGGTIVLMLGVGFLISTAITYRLSKSWGLIGAEAKSKDAKKTVNTKASEL
ncbi:MAG: hypothetical protein H0U50_14560 [Pyrinomonadaceae bacterium]|nr:hypothetical protein [Pyrinomonadaceae bacterium]